MIIHKLEQCPRAKQDLQKLVNRIKFRAMFHQKYKLNLAGTTGEKPTIAYYYCGEWKSGN